MDEIVRQAMAKWPHVPHCYGWLGLDARGNWYLRDDRAQAAGDFACGVPAAKGSPLRHDKLIEFIQRNYQSDTDGCWYFQNGPQRVFAELEATPWVWRVQPDLSVQSHTGLATRVQRCWLDEVGHVYLETDLGLGLVHTQDVTLAAEAVQAGLWVPQELRRAELPQRFGFVQSPQRDRAAGGEGG
jgi:hypothetical protein